MGIVSERRPGRRLFWIIIGKYTFCALRTIITILVLQWSIMNSPACWSAWGSTGLHLPQMPGVKQELMHFIKDVAPWIVFAALMVQLLFFIAVLWGYWDAVRVFIQRDDDESNMTWGRSKATMTEMRERETEIEGR
jgi:hypothetical protein